MFIGTCTKPSGRFSALLFPLEIKGHELNHVLESGNNSQRTKWVANRGVFQKEHATPFVLGVLVASLTPTVGLN